MSSRATGTVMLPRPAPGEGPGVTAARALVGLRECTAALAALAARGELVELAPSFLVDLAEQVHAVTDQLTAVATVSTHLVHVTGALSGSGFASTSQWLQTRARVSKTDARVELARGFDLADRFPATRDAWLAGQVPAGSVRVVCRGLVSAVRGRPRREQTEILAEAEPLLLDLARTATVTDVVTAVERVTLAVNLDGVTQSVIDAYDDQSLTIRRVGTMTTLNAYLTLETGAALTTLLEATVDSWYRSGSLTREQRGNGHELLDDLRRRERRPHLLALALGELTTQVLAAGTLGTRHGQRPHVVLDVDYDTYLARRGGLLTIPGEQPALLPSETVGRVLCDADLTPLLTTAASRGTTGNDGDPDPDPHHALDPDLRAALTAVLAEHTRTLLWLGRSRRTADTRLWTAVVHRDRHCTFPDCHVDPSRCEIHHPHPWEHGGTTDPANTALLCVRHHHTVHEGGWTMTPTEDGDPLTPGYWQFDPPDRGLRPW